MRRSDFIFKYRVRNWPEYNRALIARGSLTLWVDEQAVSGWCRHGSSRGRGRPQIYSDTAIECAPVVRAVFHLSLRATQGFLESVVRLMEVDLPVPAYSTVSRRQAGLELRLQPAPAKQPRHVVIDTTGLKVFGAGEWTVRKHGAGKGKGKGKRRTWRKLHLCVDERSKDIVAVDLTASGVHDSPHLPAVLDQVEGDVGQVSGDGAYDSGTCYEAILAGGAVPTIPPRRNARLSRAKDPPPFRAVAWVVPASKVVLHRRDRPSRGTTENPVSGTIAEHLLLGDTTVSVLRMDQPEKPSITFQVPAYVAERNALAVGERASVSLLAAAIHLMPPE